MSLTHKISVIHILLFLLLFLACQGAPDTAKVIQVIDGDTIVIEGGYHVRYIGINAPEENEPYYSESTHKNKMLVENKIIKLQKDITDKDKYGRLLRYIYVDNTLVNAEMVKHGYAYAKAYPPDTKYQIYFKSIEREARQKKIGIWK